MGTPFFSDIPFRTNPSNLDVDKVGIYGDEGYYNPGSKHTKYLLSETLAEIRKKYYVGIVNHQRSFREFHKS